MPAGKLALTIAVMFRRATIYINIAGTRRASRFRALNVATRPWQ